MAAKLHLVKNRGRETEELQFAHEDRYRYPAHEEVWEVSCEPDRVQKPRQKLTEDRRRAS
jgi:hypothetical protein